MVIIINKSQSHLFQVRVIKLLPIIRLAMRYEEKGGGVGEETVTDRIAARRSRTRSRDRLLKKERTVGRYYLVDPVVFSLNYSKPLVKYICGTIWFFLGSPTHFTGWAI